MEPSYQEPSLSTRGARFHLRQLRRDREQRVAEPGREEFGHMWWIAHERVSDVDGFFQDIRMAEQAVDDDIQIEIANSRVAESVGRRFGYCLILASITNVAVYLPARFILSLLGTGEWTVSETLTYAREMPDPLDRSEALSGILSYLSGIERQRVTREAMAAIYAIEHADFRVGKMVALAERFDPDARAELLQAAVEAARSLELTGRRPVLLADISAQVDAEQAGALVEEALKDAATLKDPAERGRAFAEVARRARGDNREQALRQALIAARKVPPPAGDWYGTDYESDKAEMVQLLAPILPTSLLDETIAVATSIEFTEEQVRALAALIPYCPRNEATSCSVVPSNCQDRARVGGSLGSFHGRGCGAGLQMRPP